VNILIGIQGRSGSSRLPDKIYKKIGPKSLLEWVYDSAFCAKVEIEKNGHFAKVVILGPEKDQKLFDFCAEHHLLLYQPTCDEKDLITRYVKAVKHFGTFELVRLTSDCWQVPAGNIIECVKALSTYDYACNTIHRTWPEGWDVQACTKQVLHWVNREQRDDREHPFLWLDHNDIIRQKFKNDKYRIFNHVNEKSESIIKTSIDTAEDLKMQRKAYESFKKSNEEMDRSE